MKETTTLKLPLYELTDDANLADGYNAAMEILDDYAKSNNAKFPITSANIEDGTIMAQDIANGQITSNKIATAAVTTEKIEDDAITANLIADGAVDSPAIKEGAVDREALSDTLFDASPTAESDNLVTSGAIHAFVEQEIADIPETVINVSTDQIQDGAVTRPKISDDAFDAEPTADSENLITSGAVAAALENFEPVDPSDPSADKGYFLAFGDSFGTTQYTDGPLWPIIAAAKLGIPEERVKNYCVTGSTFTSQPSRSQFITAIQNAAEDISYDHEKVRYVGLIGGVNDGDTSFESAMLSVIETLATNYPNAVIGIGLNAGVTTLQSSAAYQHRANAVSYNAFVTGRAFIDSFAYIACANQTIKSDQLHPTAKGSNFYGTQMACLLQGSVGAEVVGVENVTSQTIFDHTINGLTFHPTSINGRTLDILIKGIPSINEGQTIAFTNSIPAQVDYNTIGIIDNKTSVAGYLFNPGGNPFTYVSFKLINKITVADLYANFKTRIL